MRLSRNLFICIVLIALLLGPRTGGLNASPSAAAKPVAGTIFRSLAKVSIPVQIAAAVLQGYQCVRAYVRCVDSGGRVVFYPLPEALLKGLTGQVPFHCCHDDNLSVDDLISELPKLEGMEGEDKNSFEAYLEIDPEPATEPEAEQSLGSERAVVVPESEVDASVDEGGANLEVALRETLLEILSQDVQQVSGFELPADPDAKILLIADCQDIDGALSERLHGSVRESAGHGGGSQEYEQQSEPVDGLSPSIFLGP